VPRQPPGSIFIVALTNGVCGATIHAFPGGFERLIVRTVANRLPARRRGLLEGEAVAEAFCRLQRELEAGETGADDELCALVLPRVSRHLCRRWPRVDPQVIDESVEDALLWHLGHRHAYDEDRASLVTYLTQIARCRLVDRLRRCSRQAAREAIARTSQDIVVELGERPEPVWRRLRLIYKMCHTRHERRCVVALAHGMSFADVASALKIEDLSRTEQRRMVKRIKDRVRARVRRAAG